MIRTKIKKLPPTSKYCFEIETLIFDQAIHIIRRREVGFLAELTEQNHKASQAAADDMCETTSASAWPWFSCTGIYQPRSNNRGKKSP